MASTNMRIVIDADTSGAVTGVKKVAGSMAELDASAKQAAAGAVVLGKATDTTGVSADNVGRTFSKSGKIFKSTGKLLKSSGLDAAASGTAFISTIPALSGVSTALGGIVLGAESLTQVARSLGPVGLAVAAAAALAAGAAFLLMRDDVGAAEQQIRTMASANREAAAAHRDAAAAAWEQSGALLSLKGATLGEKEAALRVKEAREEVARALKAGGKGSLEYSQALLAQEKATLKVAAAEEEHGRSSLEYRTAKAAQAEATRKVTEAEKAGGKGSLEHQRAVLALARAELDMTQARRTRIEATREANRKSKEARKELRDDVAAAEEAVKRNAAATRIGVLQGKDAAKGAAEYAESLKRLKVAQDRLAAATIASGGNVSDLKTTMASLKSKAVSVKVDTQDAIFKVAVLVGQMALVASKTITLTVKTNHVEGSWNDQETIENLRKEPPKRSFEINFLSRGTANLQAQLAAVTGLQAQLDRINARRAAQDRAIAVSDAQAALAQARKKGEGIVAAERALERARQDIVTAGIEKRLTIAQRGADREQRILDKALDAARSLASQIGEAIDAATGSRIDALDNSPQAQRIREIEAAQKREANRREFGRLNADLAGAQTPEERAAAQQALNDFMLEQERQVLSDHLAQQRQAVTDEGEIKKAGAERQLSDLEMSLGKGLIKGRKFNEALLTIFRNSGVEWSTAGASMGAAFVAGLGEQIRALSPAVARALGFGKGGARSHVIGIGAGPDAPGGMRKYATGVDYVPNTGPAIIHTGEAVLNREQAAEWRAGRGGGDVQVILNGALGMWEKFIDVRVDRLAEGARRRSLAAGSVR